jgi:hypothetical protein
MYPKYVGSVSLPSETGGGAPSTGLTLARAHP